MTVQASLTSGLLLCGTLYLSSGEAISRVVVALMVVFYDGAAVPAAGVVAEDGLSALPGRGGDAQCADRRRGTGGACAAESH